MGLFETLGVPSPDQCVGVAGLTVALVGLTLGLVGVLVLELGFAAWAVVVASLFVGWVSFLYCVVWGESDSSEDVWEG